MIITSVNEASSRIEDIIDESGPLSHYEIMIITRDIYELFGAEQANELINKFDLENIGIRKY